MAKFVPSEHVESLEFDFTEYGGRSGPITEPTTKTVNQFFKNMKNLMKEVKSLQRNLKDLNIEEMDEEALAEHVGKVDESTANTEDFQRKTVEYLAELCGGVREAQEVTDGDDNVIRVNSVVVGGSPSVDDLSALPYRVLQAFSQWLMEQIKPKGTTPGLKN